MVIHTADLLVQVSRQLDQRRRDALGEYREVVLRCEEPQEGDADRLIPLMETLKISVDELEGDTRCVADVRIARALVTDTVQKLAECEAAARAAAEKAAEALRVLLPGENKSEHAYAAAEHEAARTADILTAAQREHRNAQENARLTLARRSRLMP